MALEGARTRHADAVAALDRTVGPDKVVRHEDVDALASLARELDDGVTAALWVAVGDCADALFRADAAANSCLSLSGSSGDTPFDAPTPIAHVATDLETAAMDLGALAGDARQTSLDFTSVDSAAQL